MGAAEAEAVVDLLEHGQEMVDLLGGVGRGELDPEPDLVARHHGIGGQRHVDATVEQVAPDGVKVVGGRRWRARSEGSRTRWRSPLPACPGGRARSGPCGRGERALVAPTLVDLQAQQRGGQRGHRDGAAIDVGRHHDLQELLEPGRDGDERQQDEYALEKPAASTTCRSSLRTSARSRYRGGRTGWGRSRCARRSPRSRGRRPRTASRLARGPGRPRPEDRAGCRSWS